MDLIGFENILVVGTISSWFVLIAALFMVRNIKKQARESHKLYEKIIIDLQVSNSGAVGMGQRIIALEKKLEVEKGSIVMPIETVQKSFVESTVQSQMKASNAEKPVPTRSALAEKLKQVNKPFTKSEPIVAIFSEKTSLNTNFGKVLEGIQKTDSNKENASKREDPIDRAKKMLQEGVSQTEVAKRCGLSLSEAALMAMVMQNKNTLSDAQLVY